MVLAAPLHVARVQGHRPKPQPFYAVVNLQQVGADLGLGVHLLQAPALLLQLLHLADYGHFHGTKLAPQLIRRRRAVAVLETQLWHWGVNLGPLDHSNDLAIGDSRNFSWSLLGKPARKLHF